MSKEVAKSEVRDINSTAVENYKNIQPENSMTSQEASDFWKNEFNNQSYDQWSTPEHMDNTTDSVESSKSNETDNPFSDKTIDSSEVNNGLPGDNLADTPQDLNQKAGISKEILNSELKDLTAEQKNELINNGVSPGIIDKIEYSNDVYTIKTINKDLAGKEHPETKVPYETKTVDINGIKIEGVFAVFDSKFDVNLPVDKYTSSDSAQFNYCNNQLKEAVTKNPQLKKQFSDRQLAQIESGKKPDGYTWNHNEEQGVMQLVDFEKHYYTPHVGGKAIWGGGRGGKLDEQ